MKLLPLFKFCCYLLCSVTTLAGQLRFDCDGKILIATNNGTTTSIYNPRSLPFTPPFLSILANYAGNFDALGFNAKDNFVYGVEQNTNNIVRLSLYNGVDRIGQIRVLPIRELLKRGFMILPLTLMTSQLRIRIKEGHRRQIFYLTLPKALCLKSISIPMTQIWAWSHRWAESMKQQ